MGIERAIATTAIIKVDISAPGGDMELGSWAGIYSTVNSGTTVPEYSTYKYHEGTSMAAPHVSGVASLALALDPKLLRNYWHIAYSMAAARSHLTLNAH